jgi:hypothetical protein
MPFDKFIDKSTMSTKKKSKNDMDIMMGFGFDNIKKKKKKGVKSFDESIEGLY